jgi:hypothetical protein
MQFMVLSSRHTEQYGEADFDAVIPAETQRIRQFYADGVVRQIWLRSDLPDACFLIEAPDEHTAQSTVSALPMARSGLSDDALGTCRLPLDAVDGVADRSPFLSLA